jgi:hypothetical protein
MNQPRNKEQKLLPTVAGHSLCSCCVVLVVIPQLRDEQSFAVHLINDSMLIIDSA